MEENEKIFTYAVVRCTAAKNLNKVLAAVPFATFYRQKKKYIDICVEQGKEDNAIKCLTDIGISADSKLEYYQDGWEFLLGDC